MKIKNTELYNVYIYDFPYEHNIPMAVQWMCDIINTDILQIDKIILNDSIRRMEEENSTKELFVPIDKINVIKQINEFNINEIFIHTVFDKIKLTVCIDLNHYQISVAIRKKYLIDQNVIEKLFFKI